MDWFRDNEDSEYMYVSHTNEDIAIVSPTVIHPYDTFSFTWDGNNDSIEVLSVNRRSKDTYFVTSRFVNDNISRFIRFGNEKIVKEEGWGKAILHRLVDLPVEGSLVFKKFVDIPILWRPIK